MKTGLKLWSMLLCLSLLMGMGITGIVSAGAEGDGERIRIEIFAPGWVNTPTDENDPFKKYMDEKYNADVIMTATADFANQAAVRFASDSPPDIISVASMVEFEKLYEQGVLLEDWTPYVEQMPNFKILYDANESTRTLLTRDGMLMSPWTMDAGIVWSLKIRTDWLDKMGLEAPKTPEDLIELGKAFTFDDPDGNGTADTFGFTDAGAGVNFNLMGGWVPLMFGDVTYIDGDHVTNGIVDGTHKLTLDFIRSLVKEEIIDPNWFLQTYDLKVLDYQGKVGVQWHPGIIQQLSELNNGSDGSTIGWWDTYDLPKSEKGNALAGLMPAAADFSHLITVSAKAALDPEKMEKCVQIINDVIATPEGRPETYDALRWAVGIQPGQELIPIEGTSSVYANTVAAEGEPKFYWEEVAGGWDWGCWFNIPDGDGVIYGSTPLPTEVAIRSAIMDEKTQAMPRVPSLGMVKWDAAVLDRLSLIQAPFEYNYVFGMTDDYDGFVQEWLESGGQELLDSATEQCKALGLITE